LQKGKGVKLNGFCCKSHEKGIAEMKTLCLNAFAEKIKYPVGISVET